MTLYDPFTAQRAAENAATPTAIETAAQQFEREKAAVTSYEAEWDDWDGPVWPVGTVQVVLKSPVVTEVRQKTPEVHVGDC